MSPIATATYKGLAAPTELKVDCCDRTSTKSGHDTDPSTRPPAVQTATGNGWIRLRWGGAVPLLGFNTSTGLLVPVTGDVKSIQIVFDEGQDTGPDFFGLAVLDNIDVNGTLVGDGDNKADNKKDKNKDKDHRGENDDDQGEDD